MPLPFAGWALAVAAVGAVVSYLAGAWDLGPRRQWAGAGCAPISQVPACRAS